MSIWYPSFYPAFRCKAAACRHSCCRGWEIDVDEGSAALYRELPGKLGEDLRAALFEDGEGWHFRLTAEERCPLLQQDGLCRLIRELGEEALCDICALHPRFFQEIGEDELWGLGLSCEAVTELLLRQPALRFTCRETGETADLEGLLRRLGFDPPQALLRYAPRIDEARRREQKLADEARKKAEKEEEAARKKAEKAEEEARKKEERAAERRKAKIESQLISAGGQILKRGLLNTLFKGK